MNENYIENTLNELKRSSKVSLVMVALGAICLLGGVFYSATHLAPLEERVSQLDTALQEKQTTLDKVEDQLKMTAAAFDLLQEGTHFLFNRQYDDSLASFNKYLSIFPDSSEALAMLGYAELRYAKYLRQQSKDKNIVEPDVQKYLDDERKYLVLSEAHLKKAIHAQKQQSHPWSTYNLTLLYMHIENKEAALSTLSDMLSSDSAMVKWVCEDGQFRQMKIDKDISQEFTKLVDSAARLVGLNTCWVTKPVNSVGSS